jgi:hypothetical protein
LQVSTTEDDSDDDQQRCVERQKQRFTYEHFDGIGDDASSDSKDAVDEYEDSVDDITKVWMK